MPQTQTHHVLIELGFYENFIFNSSPPSDLLYREGEYQRKEIVV
jgi:hypothetical protein